MNWKVEKIFVVAAILISAVLLLLASFKETPEQNYARRLEAFRTILPVEARGAFDSNERDKATRIIEDTLEVDAVFKEKYEALKNEECIGIFTPREVVDFFRDYFVNYKGKK